MRQSGVSKESEWLHVLSIERGQCVSRCDHNDTAMLAETYHAKKGLMHTEPPRPSASRTRD